MSNKNVRSVLSIGLLLILHSSTVYAWKPYTHIYTADQARNEAIDNGYVTVNGRRYKVREEIVQALTRWPEYFNAGVIGPDGFPDIVYGQSIIHPSETGLWLRHIYVKAWEAQSGSKYTADQKGQILAFTYGYLAHAAGDMWAHTLVNDFAGGVFPSVKNILEEGQLEIVIRHLIVEAYVGDATPGYDGNPERERVNEEGKEEDWSDDSTRGIKFEAPHDFIYDTLIDTTASTPSRERGAVVDLFLRLRFWINGQLVKLPAPAKIGLKGMEEDFSNFRESCRVKSFIRDHKKCGQAWTKLKTEVRQIIQDDVEGWEAVKTLARVLWATYLNWWLTEIDAGLKEWSRIGLASSKAIFDPQARRDEQNMQCLERGPDRANSFRRAKCEERVKIGKALFRQSEDFIEYRLPSMLGLPPKMGRILPLLRKFEDLLDKALAPFNPVREGEARIAKKVTELRNELVRFATGFDVERADYFVRHPTAWLDVVEQVKLPGFKRSVQLFDDKDHDRLDRYMGMSGEYLIRQQLTERHPRFGKTVTRLDDKKGVFDPDKFAAVRNTITTIKLVLLDGEGLNQVIADVLADSGAGSSGRCLQLYPSRTILDPLCNNESVRDDAENNINPLIPANFMIHSYRSTSDVTPAPLWLHSIDSDHSWRRDGLPRFCDKLSINDCKSLGALKAVAIKNREIGGNGTMPLWKSCAGRQVFRLLFRDWESGEQQFPDYGDPCVP